MKDSGVEWVKQIPEEWQISSNSHLFSFEKKIVGNEWAKIQLLSLTKKGIVTKNINDGSGKQPESFSTYQQVHKKQLVMCLFDLDVSAVFSGVSNYDGMISPAYKVFSINQSLLYPKYIDYYFQAIFINRNYVMYSKSLRKTIDTDNFMSIKTIVPPLSEQQKIADFLDEKVKEIDNAIEKTKETIELYKKYKQAIITEAVTKGLDPNVEMKDSGVEWIGKIPVDWQVKRAKNVVTEFAKGAGITKEDVDINGDISCVRYGEIYTKYDIDFVQTFSRTSLSQINTPKYIEKGDILFSGTGELVEEIGKNIVYLGNEPCIAGGDIIIAKHKCNASFLNYAFKSSYSQMQKSSGKSKLKVVHISASDIGNILLAIPPACEQEAIANYLNQKIDLINFINKSLNELVPMFENYKKSLIYEYVTGKKEVK